MPGAALDLTKLFLLLALAFALAATGCARSSTMPASPGDAGRALPDAAPPPDAGGACAPMDAVGRGFCALQLGVAWNGAACVGIDGCTCEGADCDRLHATHEACAEATAACEPLDACGGFAGFVCGPGEWCDHADDTCGAADGAGLCRARPTVCSKNLDVVCGCDGAEYSNPCEAHRAGTDVAVDGCP